MKNYGICLLSSVPVRKEPSERSEMISQLLFGELVNVLEHKKGWLKIIMTFDNYEGWISDSQLYLIDQKSFDQYLRSWSFCATDLVSLVKEEKAGMKIPVVLGSSFPRMLRANFIAGDHSFSFKGKLNKPHEQTSRRSIIAIAKKYLGAPYLWGGRSPFGLDCSGFVQVVYKVNQQKMPRDAWQQALMGEILSFPEEALPGDLAFFDNEEGKVIHVGIILKGGKIIHSSGTVRIDKLDHQGIYNEIEKRYTHRLRMIRRVV
ncbi:MAG: C40 family peptidase [Bacteroidota bacterium]